MRNLGPEKSIPFLKWAGGKRWLVRTSQFKTPEIYNRYFEPFLGGGATFFALEPRIAILADINFDLIEVYEVIKNNKDEFLEVLAFHSKKHSKDYYYKVREKTHKSKIQRAAKLVYLNRTCWNGLYRVNLKGEFNVPIGTKTNVLLNSDDFNGISNLLKRTTLIAQDFEKTIDSATKGDFVYLDPPYTVQHNHNNFIKYNQNIFSWDDQERLRDTVLRAHRRGVYLLMSNADHECVRTLYLNDLNIETMQRHSVLAAASFNRNKTTEILISNY